MLRGCILADDMGLGKTLSALVTAKVHQKVVPGTKAIVICPASLLRNWKREAKGAGIEILPISWRSIPASIEGDFVLIADEAHYAQNPQSKQTQAFLALCGLPNCQAVYLLSGTPIKNGRPINLLPLLGAINHALAKYPLDYQVKYCDGHYENFGYGNVWVANGVTGQDASAKGRTLDTLHALTNTSILRRLKSEVLNLPPKIRSLREVALSPKAQRTYDETFNRLRAEYQSRLRKGTIKGGGEKLVLLGQVRHAGSIAKAETAIEIAEEVIEEGGSIIIFVDFVHTAHIIAQSIQGAEVFTGETSTAKRQTLVDAFQAGKIKCLVITGGSGGVGITLTAAQTVLLVDRPWTPGDAIQREDRAYRIGQTGTVSSIWLQHGPVDEFVDGVLIEKAKNAEHILAGDPGSPLGFDSEADIAAGVIEVLGW